MKFEEAKASVEALRESRESARDSAVSTIRALEMRLQEVLDGEKLRGLPNLGTRLEPYYATRVSSERNDAKLPSDRDVLVLTFTGQLCVVRFDVQASNVVSRPIRDEEIVFEDLALVTKKIVEVLDRFVFLSAGRTDRADKARELSEKLSEVLKQVI